MIAPYYNFFVLRKGDAYYGVARTILPGEEAFIPLEFNPRWATHDCSALNAVTGLDMADEGYQTVGSRS